MDVLQKNPPAEAEAATARDLSLEERLEPKLKDAEYLLVLVLAFMLWTAGFVDLFTHTSQDAAILGLYSVSYFLFMLVYCLGFGFWYWLIFPQNSIDRFRAGLRFLQRNTLAGVGLLAAFGLILASMFIIDRWATFPLMEASIALLILLGTATVLLARPDGEATVVLPWRRAARWLAVGLIGAELVLQALAFARLLPVQNTSGLFNQYGRVYQNEEGFASGRVNELGWYYPEFVLAEDTRHIVLLGDTTVQGLQVRPEENMGVQLQDLFGDEAAAEVVAMGMPGYGPGLYLDVLLYPYILQPARPEEVVVFFHLGDDFQTSTGPGGSVPHYILDENGQTVIHSDDFGLRHTLQHVLIRGYEPVNPVRTASTHLFTFNLIDRLARQLTGKALATPVPARNTDFITAEDPFGEASFMFAAQSSPEAEHAFQIATGLLKTYHEKLKAEGVTMRLVSVPYFPPSLFEQYPSGAWQPEVGEYNALLPERRLKEFAAGEGIPFLGLGETFLAQGLAVEDLQSLYFRNGSGRFTPAGHRAAAQAVYACFYDPAAACPEPQGR